jgi:hypothetical protein
MTRYTGQPRKWPKAFVLGLALALCLFSGPLPQTALAGPLKSKDFDALYGKGGNRASDASAGGGMASGESARQGLDLSLEGVFEGMSPDWGAAEMHAAPKTGPLAGQVASRRASESEWWVVPLLPKRNADSEMTLLETLTPMGVGVVHRF